MGIKKYDLSLVILSVTTLIISYFLSTLQNRFFTNEHYWIPTLFFLITTFLTNKLLIAGNQQSKEFVFKTLAISMARLLVCMIVVLVYSLIFKSQVLAFVSHFMLAYLVFTFFEVSYLIKNISNFKSTG
ncbi:MAG: hypothetical protein ACK504_03570 [Bacteroidota bacterium]|jgi:hypothetical protein